MTSVNGSRMANPALLTRRSIDFMLSSAFLVAAQSDKSTGIVSIDGVSDRRESRTIR